uniref:Saposin B-type domain-containing protein n=1 Tax=Strongyloides papillosus TaxID=174720 RepID=A0A0N5CCS2_STREA
MDNAISTENDLKYSGSLGCYLCSQLMTITQSKMALNQVQLKNILNQRCSDLSNFIKAQCFTFVTESLPQIYYSLTYDMSQKNICEMLNLCEINKFTHIENTSSNNNNNQQNKVISDNIHPTVVKPMPIIDVPTNTNDMDEEELDNPMNKVTKKNVVSMTRESKVTTTTQKNIHKEEKSASNNSEDSMTNYMTEEKVAHVTGSERPIKRVKKPKTVVYVPSDIKSEAKIPEFEDLTNPVRLDAKGMRMTCLFCEKMLNNAKNYAISAKTEISNFANNTCAKLTKSTMSEQCYKLTDRKISELANFVDEQVVEALWCAQMNNC